MPNKANAYKHDECTHIKILYTSQKTTQYKADAKTDEIARINRSNHISRTLYFAVKLETIRAVVKNYFGSVRTNILFLFLNAFRKSNN